MSKTNPVIGHVRNVPIRETNRFNMSLHHTIYQPLVERAAYLNISVAQLVMMHLTPCQHCGNDKITIQMKPLKIKKANTGYKQVDHFKNQSLNGQVIKSDTRDAEEFTE